MHHVEVRQPLLPPLMTNALVVAALVVAALTDTAPMLASFPRPAVDDDPATGHNAAADAQGALMTHSASALVFVSASVLASASVEVSAFALA